MIKQIHDLRLDPFEFLEKLDERERLILFQIEFISNIIFIEKENQFDRKATFFDNQIIYFTKILATRKIIWKY